MRKNVFVLKVLTVFFVIALFSTAFASEKPEIFVQLGHSSYVHCVAISPDGKFAVSGSMDRTLKYWEIETGREIKTFTGHTKDVISVAITLDGKYALSGSKDKTLNIWNLTTGEETRTLRGYSDAVSAIAVTPDGKYAISGGGSILKLWEIATGKEIRTFEITNDELDLFAPAFRSIAISPDMKYMLSGGGHYLVIWDLATGKEIRRVKGLEGYGIGIQSVAITSDGKYALSGGDKTVKLWDFPSGQEIRTFWGHTDSVWSVAATPDGKYALSGSYDNTLKLWEISTGRLAKTFTGDSTYGVRSVAVTPDGKYALSGSTEKRLGLWDIETGKEIRTFEGNTSHIASISITGDGNYALTGNWDRKLKLWDITTGRLIKTIPGHNNPVGSVIITPDGKYAVSGSYDTLKFWDMAAGREIRTVKINNYYWINHLAITTDGKYVFSPGGDETIKLWEIAKGREVKKFRGPTNYNTPDGKYTLSGDGENFKLYDIGTGREIEKFTTLSNALMSMPEFEPKIASPDGRYTLTGGSDGVLRIHDQQSRRELAKAISFTDGEWIVITPEGYYNSSAKGDKHLNVRIGNNVYDIENYREAFYRPDLVKLALSGGSLKEFRKLADIKEPPVVSIVNTPASTDKDEITVTLKIVDSGGGVGDIRLYLNGSAVMLDSARGVKIVASNQNEVLKTYNLKLSNGLNSIRAIAFNGDNTMQSNDAIYQITASFKTFDKPSLNALIIGINDYKNPKLQLNYAVADAKLFADKLKTGASALFDKVNIKMLLTTEETTSENIIKELKAMRRLHPDDLFVFYVASHGTVDDGEYFLITSNVGSTRTEKLKTDALPQGMLKELIANIPATKKLIIIDTCSAGALGEAIQVAMLTRGMSEDTAMKILSRAVGSTILSASTSIQEALEGYNGHGLFTYVLTEGLSGKADKGKSGYVKTTELADYVDNEVPVLAEKVFKKAQYPTISISGQAFPIGKVK